jgi:signal transduction histidine kinase
MLDPDLTKRALENLVTNAIFHSELAGEVAIEATRLNGRLMIEVVDQDPGIAPEIEGRLFEPFMTGRSGGTALGGRTLPDWRFSRFFS